MSDQLEPRSLHSPVSVQPHMSCGSVHLQLTFLLPRLETPELQQPIRASGQGQLVQCICGNTSHHAAVSCRAEESGLLTQTLPCTDTR